MKNINNQIYTLLRMLLSAYTSLFILVGCNSGGGSDSGNNLTPSVQSELRSIQITESSLRWYEDNNLGVAGEVPLDFYSRMASPDDWEQALKVMDVFYLRSSSFQKHLSANPTFAQELASLLAKHSISLAIDETAATWANSGLPNRSNTQFSQSIAMLDELTEAGFNIRYISLQSVLSKPLKSSEGNILDYPYEKRYLDISSYMSKISSLYPNIEFGIIDALPTKTTSHEYQSVYQGLFDHLSEKKLNLSYLHLDLPINLINQEANSLTAKTVKQVRLFVTSTLNWRFGWIVTDHNGGYSDSASFAQTISQGLSEYLDIGGKADDYILSAWFPYPDFTIPEQYSSEMPSFATFRMMDQILNVSGNGNSKQCSFEITGNVENAHSFRYVTYQTVQKTPVVYRLYCDPDQNISLTDGTVARATKPIYQCMKPENNHLYFSTQADCGSQGTSTPPRLGYLFPRYLPGTTPLYQCQSVDEIESGDCPDNLTGDSRISIEPLGYF